MKTLTFGIVGAGLLLALALGFRQGFDSTSITILVLIAIQFNFFPKVTG